MNENSKKNMKSWISNISTAILIFIAAASMQGLFEVSGTQMIMRKLSDCFLIPGAVLGGIAALCWVAVKGNFDMLGYGAKTFIDWMIHPRKKQESYFEYKMRQEEKNPTGAWPWRMLIVGLVCIALSMVFAVLFEVVV